MNKQNQTYPYGEAAFLIVKKYPYLFSDDEVMRLSSNYQGRYAVPMSRQHIKQMSIQYRGIDREPIEPGCNAPYVFNENLMGIHYSLAEIRMHEIKEKMSKEILQGNYPYNQLVLLSLQDALSVLEMAEAEFPDMYEMIWVKIAGGNALSPEGFTFMGYEPNYYPNGYFSPVCETMCVPHWGSVCYEEGDLFQDYFKQLNEYGLFNDEETALAFLQYFLSFEYDDTLDLEYEIVEVYCLPSPYSSPTITFS